MSTSAVPSFNRIKEILDLIMVAAGIGITKNSSKEYYLGLVLVIIGFIFAIVEIVMAAGGFNIGGVACKWFEAIIDTIIVGLLLGILYFNKKEILG